MACGCNETCNCVIQGGDGITTSGTGTPGNPYVIDATGNAVTVADTNSVDLTKTGDVITADVIRDPEPTNLLVIGPNGLDVPCEAVQDCVGAGFDQFGGLQYDDVNNSYFVKISNDAGNTTGFGADGGVFTPPAPITLGCGLEFGTFGEVQADVQDFATLTRRNCNDTADAAGTTPLDPACELEGMAVYCGSDGNLRTKPEKFTEVAQAQMNEAFSPSITALPFTTSAIQIGATNPSDCYCMCGYVQFAFIPAISGAPGTVIQLNHEIDLGTGIFSALTGFIMDNRGKTATSTATFRPVAPLNICLDPGETKIIRQRLVFQRDPSDNGGAVTITGAAREIRFVGSNL